MSDTPNTNYKQGRLDPTILTDNFKTFTAATINVCGGMQQNFFSSLSELGAQRGLDIIGVQETKVPKDKEKQLLPHTNICQYRGVWEHTKSNYHGKGVGLLIKKSWFTFLISTATDGNGRGVMALFGFRRGFQVAVINCYIPSKSHTNTVERQKIILWVQNQVASLRTKGARVVLLGDFNGVIDPSIDRSSTTQTTTAPELPLFTWLSAQNLIDTYRFLHPTKSLYSFREVSRIDFVWASSDLASYIIDTDTFELVEPIRSDHKVVATTFDIHTLIDPTPQSVLKAHHSKSKKILYSNADDEQWGDFTHQIERTLPEFGNLDTMGLADLLNSVEPSEYEASQETLETLPLNTVWETLQEFIMSAAFANLPSIKVGGIQKPKGEACLQAKTRDLGSIIQAVRSKFINKAPVDSTLKELAHKQIQKWYASNGVEMGMEQPPVAKDGPEVWEKWMSSVQEHWRASRLSHHAHIQLHRQKTINDHIDRRDIRFKTHTRETIRSILDMVSGRVMLDHLVVEDDPEHLYVTDDPAEIKRRVRQYFEDTFHAERFCQTLDDFWTTAYQPRTDIAVEWYDTLMDTPTRNDIVSAINNAPSEKAPGISGVTGDLLKRLGPLSLSVFVTLIQACVVQGQLPNAWLQGLIYCIPKGSTWSGKISEVRPLTLLEHARKIMFSILVDRLTGIFTRHNILRGPNFSVLKGTMTKDPIHILNSVMEDAREFDKEVWIMFQDMRRCFDSVSCGQDGMLDRGMTHLKIPERFADLCKWIAANKTNKIITAFGPTEEYHPRCGLDQGGVECPIFWRIAYEVLLAVVMDSGLGYPIMRRAALAEHHKLPPVLPENHDAPLLVAALAFMDDTTWSAPSKQNLQEIVDIASSFFKLNQIEVNPKKTELLVINPSTQGKTIQLGTDIVEALPPTTAARMLGVWFSADGKSNHTRSIVWQEVRTVCQILARKAVTDKQAIYIVNNVLIPRILYRLTTTILKDREIKEIVGHYTGVIRQKLGLAKGTPNSILHHRRFYGLRHFRDVQDEEQISTALLRHNDPGLVGQVMAAREMAHQMECRLPISPLELPAVGATFDKHNFHGHICRLIHKRHIEFRRPENEDVDNPLIAAVLPPDTYHSVANQLHRDGVTRMSDVTTTDGSTLDSWNKVKQNLQLKGMTRRWYKVMRAYCSDNITDNAVDHAFGAETVESTINLVIDVTNHDDQEPNGGYDDRSQEDQYEHTASCSSSSDDEPMVNTRRLRRATALVTAQNANNLRHTSNATVVYGDESTETDGDTKKDEEVEEEEDEEEEEDGEGEDEGVYKEKGKEKAKSEKRRKHNTFSEVQKKGKKEIKQPVKINTRTLPDGTHSSYRSTSPFIPPQIDTPSPIPAQIASRTHSLSPPPATPTPSPTPAHSPSLPRSPLPTLTQTQTPTPTPTATPPSNNTDSIERDALAEMEQNSARQTQIATERFQALQSDIVRYLQQQLNSANAKYVAYNRKYTRDVAKNAVMAANPENLRELLIFNENERRKTMERLKVRAQQELDSAIRWLEKETRAITTERQNQIQSIHESYLIRQRNREANRLQQQQKREEKRRKAEEKRRIMKEKYPENERSFKLLPQYRVTTQEGDGSGLVLAKIGPMHLSLLEAEAVEAIQQTPVDNSHRRTISSDGSMINSGKETIAMAFGVADLSQPTVRTVQGRTDGYASSAKPELMGLFAAIISAPPEQDILVQLDNESVVEQYQQLVKHRSHTLPRKRQRSNFAGLWAVLHQTVRERPGTVEVEWVRGHVGNAGNTMADTTATTAARVESTPWTVDLSMQSDISKFAYCQNIMTEVDLRQQLKQQTTIRRHQEWTAQRRTKRAIRQVDEIEWRSTLSIVHNKRPVHTFFSSAKDTRERTHRIKKLHGMLPTMNVMHARRPDLYPDDICCVCEIEGEDNHHIWTCSAIEQVTKDIIEEGLSKINGWGSLATAKHNKEAREHFIRAKASGRKDLEPTQPIFWHCPERSTCIKGLSSIGGTRSLLLGEGYYDRATNLKWSVSDLYRGIMPTVLIKEWGPLFAVPLTIARTVIHKFVSHMEKKATELIWKPRCKDTVSNEKQRGVIARQKKAVYKGPRGNWEDGYGYYREEDQCVCGEPLKDHRDEICPGATVDTYSADSTLLQSLLGKRHLSTMERMGRVGFI